MSWIIQSLLKNSIEIKTQSDLDSDDFNNLLIVEKKIKEMRKDGLLTQKDIDLLEQISDGKPLYNTENSTNKSKIALARKFYKICERIAFALGDEFTDEGYLSALQKKQHLTDEEVEKGRKYMKGRYRYKIMRKL